MQPFRAIRAFCALARSGGKDLQQGVAFLRATEGRSARTAFERFRTSATGQAVLQRQQSLRDHLLDRDGLARMPADSFGRSYLAFMESQHVSVPGLLDLATSHPELAFSQDERRFAERTHVMHDLWHVVTGYSTDDAGEVCILAVRSAQMRHIGVWLLCLGGMLKLQKEMGRRPARAAVREAYARGQRASWLYGVDWETLLPQSLESVRAQLQLEPPVHYPVRVTSPQGLTETAPKHTSPRNRIRPLSAFRALRALARSGGKDYRQAAAFMNATEGRSGQRAFARFQASADGARLLRNRPDLPGLLGANLQALSTLEPGTLGRAYHDFMAQHGFSVEGMAELGEAGAVRPMNEAETWFARRMNALHDVRHVIAGYGQEPLGELCLLAFRFAQARHPGMAFFAVLWGLKTALSHRGQPVLTALREGYRRGRDSVWMDDLDWEQMMHEQLATVRSRLGLSPPVTYDRIRAAAPAVVQTAHTISAEPSV